MEYTLVRNDQGDWIGLYKDGKLVSEGHSFGSSELLSLVGIRHDLIWDVTLDDSLPETLDEAIQLPNGIIRTIEPK